MRYYARKGIVLTRIGGKPLLISAWALHKEVPYVTEINETTALCWDRLISGAEEEDLIRSILEEFDVEDTDLVQSDIHLLLENLCSGGYVEVR